MFDYSLKTECKTKLFPNKNDRLSNINVKVELFNKKTNILQTVILVGKTGMDSLTDICLHITLSWCLSTRSALFSSRIRGLSPYDWWNIHICYTYCSISYIIYTVYYKDFI